MTSVAGCGIPWRVGATDTDIVQDPLLVPAFLVDIPSERLAQPFLMGVHAAAAGHQQRHGMADRVVGLYQEGNIGRQRDFPADTAPELWNREEFFTRATGARLQHGKEFSQNITSLRPAGRRRNGPGPAAPLPPPANVVQACALCMQPVSCWSTGSIRRQP
jgi:hypothetical protein